MKGSFLPRQMGHPTIAARQRLIISLTISWDEKPILVALQLRCSGSLLSEPPSFRSKPRAAEEGRVLASLPSLLCLCSAGPRFSGCWVQALIKETRDLEDCSFWGAQVPFMRSFCL